MDAKHTGKIYGINGPVIYLKGRTGFKMSEMVYVGEERLVGEVISLDKDRTTIQVYEETSGLKPGEIVEGTGDAVSVILAPGIINNIFDGIERPLEKIAQASNGAFITRGVSVDSLDLDKLWRRMRSCINVWFRRMWKESWSVSYLTDSIISMIHLL